MYPYPSTNVNGAAVEVCGDKTTNSVFHSSGFALYIYICVCVRVCVSSQPHPIDHRWHYIYCKRPTVRHSGVCKTLPRLFTNKFSLYWTRGYTQRHSGLFISKPISTLSFPQRPTPSTQTHPHPYDDHRIVDLGFSIISVKDEYNNRV